MPEISPAEGKLGVLLVGLGAVSTTFIAGVEAIKKGFAQPIGSLTQMGTIRLGKRTDNRVPLIKDFVPLAQLKDLVFGAWDIFPDSAYDAALNAGVLEKELLAQLKEPLRKIRPMKAVFDQNYVKRLSGTNVKTGKNKFELAQQLIDEIAERIRMLGPVAPGTLTEMLQNATLTERPGQLPDERGMVSDLVADHEAIIRHLRKDLRACDEQYDDMGTSDFLTGLMEKHEKMAWLLRAHIEQRG